MSTRYKIINFLNKSLQSTKLQIRALKLQNLRDKNLLSNFKQDSFEALIGSIKLWKSWNTYSHGLVLGITGPGGIAPITQSLWKFHLRGVLRTVNSPSNGVKLKLKTKMVHFVATADFEQILAFLSFVKECYYLKVAVNEKHWLFLCLFYWHFANLWL